MNRIAHILCLLICITVASFLCSMQAQTAVPSEWRIGIEHYHDVRVVSQTPESVTIHHRGGLTQLFLRDLPDELQRLLNYDPSASKAYRAEVQQQIAERRQQELARQTRRNDPNDRNLSPVERSLQRLGQPPPRVQVDLRPLFNALELHARNQGRRPSCAVFSIVSALEFQQAVATQKVEKLSEEYLLWAVQKLLGMTLDDDEDSYDLDRDAGFSLSEVLLALRTYGIALQSEMPNTYGSRMSSIKDPPREVIERAIARRNVFMHQLPGRTRSEMIDNIIHCLSNGVPVPIGIGWPHYRTLRQPFLDGQQPLPGYGHSVTIVGCFSETGEKEDLRFIFKNSYGPRWGIAGYGVVSYHYLSRHLMQGVILEVR